MAITKAGTKIHTLRPGHPCSGLFHLALAVMACAGWQPRGMLDDALRVPAFQCATDNMPADTFPAWMRLSADYGLLYMARSDVKDDDAYGFRGALSGGAQTGTWALSAQFDVGALRMYWNEAADWWRIDGSMAVQQAGFFLRRNIGVLRLSGWCGAVNAPGMRTDSALAAAGVWTGPGWLTGGFRAQMNCAKWSGAIGAGHGIFCVQTVDLVDVESSARRAFSAATIEDAVWCNGGAHAAISDLSIDAKFGRLTTTRVTGIERDMPLSGHGIYSTVNGAALLMPGRWNIRASGSFETGGGYLAGYDGSAVRFALADSLQWSGWHGALGWTAPFHAGIGAYVRSFWLGAPRAHISTAPFNSWAMFDPTEYHLRNGIFAAREIGAGVNDTLRRGIWTVRPAATLIYGAQSVDAVTKEMKVLLLIPYFTNEDTIRPIDMREIMLKVECSAGYKGRRMEIGMHMRQYVPLHVEDRTIGGGPSAQPAKKTGRRAGFEFGGFSAGLDCTWHLRT